MRPITVIGIVLILLGIVGFAIKSITYTKDTTKLDVGPLEVTASEKRTVDIPDIAAGAAVVAGVVLVFAGRSASKRG